MQIDRILYPITTLGPGNRLVIWTIGCSKHCVKCANPELWEENSAKDVGIDNLVNLIKQGCANNIIDGITITGGDPLEQIAELIILLQLLKNITNDIILYTGYTISEIEKEFSHLQWEKVKQQISVLIDGPYIDELNDNNCVLRGSRNQNIIFFDESKKDIYESYLEKGRSVQNVFYNEKMISVGIHNNNL